MASPLKQKKLRILLWNVEWAAPGSKRARIIRERIRQTRPEVVCIAEGYESFLGTAWSTVSGGIDPGYRTIPGRRKILLSAKASWHSVQSTGPDGFSSGRFVCAKLCTPIGPIWFIAICIPWSHAHVNHGRRDRAAWEEHILSLEALDRFFVETAFDAPVIVLGDFNQRVPHSKSPIRCYQKLHAVISSRFDIVTAGSLLPVGKQSIDHVGLDVNLSATTVTTLPAVASDGTRLSDHFGVVVDVSIAGDRILDERNREAAKRHPQFIGRRD